MVNERFQGFRKGLGGPPLHRWGIRTLFRFVSPTAKATGHPLRRGLLRFAVRHSVGLRSSLAACHNDVVRGRGFVRHSVIPKVYAERLRAFQGRHGNQFRHRQLVLRFPSRNVVERFVERVVRPEVEEALLNTLETPHDRLLSPSEAWKRFGL